MTELDLYKFLESTSTEIHWWGDNELIIWLHPMDIKDFADLVGYDYLSEGGIECNLQGEGYIALNIFDLCEHFDIDPNKICDKEND